MKFDRTSKVARVIALDTATSTNDIAAQWVSGADMSAIEGFPPQEQWDPDGMSIISARSQTQGRGRNGHTWMSKPDESFICSFISAVDAGLAADPKLNGWFTILAGVSVLDALRNTLTDSHLTWGKGPAVFANPINDALLKWPNDIVYHGHKLGGILTQLVPLPQDSSRIAMIFGIGLNIAIPHDDLPTDQSTSWQLITDTTTGYARPDTAYTIDMIAAYTAQGLQNRLWEFGLHHEAYAQDLRRRALQECWTLGRSVLVHYTDGTTQTGIAHSITDDASLSMTTDDGRMTIVHTADVGVLPAGD